MKGTQNVMALFVALFVGIALGAGGLTLVNRQRPAAIEIIPPLPTPTLLPTITPGPIRVFVSGEVVSPAVYALAPGSIARDVIEMAGGFTAAADTAVVNLAYPLQDGMQILVPTLGKSTPVADSVIIAPENYPVGAAPDTGSERVDINTATAVELDALPGIGPSTAQKIIDYRAENGRFQTLEDIMKVPGIGVAKFEQIKAFITIHE